MDIETIKVEFLTKYKVVGKAKFEQFLLYFSLSKLAAIETDAFEGVSPEVELMEFYEQFLVLSRREDDEMYFDIAKAFRKIAHKVYRIMLKKKIEVKNEGLFLRMVRV